MATHVHDALFLVAGTALSALWWSPLIFQTQSALLLMLFIGTPGISAAIAGYIFGKQLFDQARVRKPIASAIRGAAIASLALVLFAPMFAALYVWTQPATEHWDVLGLTLLVLVAGALIAWIKVALIGAVVGLGLSTSLRMISSERLLDAGQ